MRWCSPRVSRWPRSLCHRRSPTRPRSRSASRALSLDFWWDAGWSTHRVISGVSRDPAEKWTFQQQVRRRGHDDGDAQADRCELQFFHGTVENNSLKQLADEFHRRDMVDVDAV